MTHERKKDPTAIPREKRQPEHPQRGEQDVERERQPQREREVGRSLDGATPQR